jgi:death-on-curing protein
VKNPTFLTLNEVLYIHREQIRHLGGSDGIRDMGLLQSALAMPSAEFGGQYLHEDIFHMAAAYLFHIALNHPFLDGNKRVGAMAADVFLDLNGYELQASCEAAFEKLVLDTAQGKTEKAAIAAFFRKYSKKSRRKA